MDGTTRFTLTDEPIESAGEPLFDDFLETPSCNVSIFSSHNEVILEVPVQRTRTRVRIWTNHPSEPDDVLISVAAG